LKKLTKSELMVVMTSGMAHVSGGIMAAYIAFGIKAERLLTAVIMTAPGTLLMAKMLVPETEQPLTAGRVEMPEMEKETNFLGAISRGTIDGLQLALKSAPLLVYRPALSSTESWAEFQWFPGSPQTRASFRLDFAPWLDHRIPWQVARRWAAFSARAWSLTNRCVPAPRRNQNTATAHFAIATFALCGFAISAPSAFKLAGSTHSLLSSAAAREIRRWAMLAGTMANLMSASIVRIRS
jgi:CNT family concentrative nucleoside transporter